MIKFLEKGTIKFARGATIKITGVVTSERLYLLLAILAPTVAVAALILFLLCGCHKTPEESEYNRAE